MPTLTLGELVVPDTIFTFEGFRAWVRTLDEDAPRVCFANGEVFIELARQCWKTHLCICSELNFALKALSRELDLGCYFGQGGWISASAGQLSNEPDGCLVRWETLESGAARFAAASVSGPEIELRGRADMALEVVSKTSERKDLEVLRAAYARAGFPEYWIADGRGDSVELRIFRLEDGTYHEVAPDPQGWLHSPVWGGRFRPEWSRDRAGLWRLDLAFEQH